MTPLPRRGLQDPTIQEAKQGTPFLAKEKRTWEAHFAQVTHPTPTANSHKSSCFPTTAFPGTPSLTGAEPGSAKHVSAGWPWKHSQHKLPAGVRQCPAWIRVSGATRRSQEWQCGGTGRAVETVPGKFQAEGPRPCGAQAGML
ncbi:uncharacterized protein ACIB01_011686 isoform 1-T1 [Guaruba guarouba]